jgi:hypothetical protein
MYLYSRSVLRKGCPYLALILLASVAHGQSALLPLASPSIQMFLDADSVNQTVNSDSFGTQSAMVPFTPSTFGNISVSGSVFGGLDPSVSSSILVNVTSSDSNFPFADSFSTLTYAFEVTGPADAFVPVEIKGTLSDSWTANLDDNGGFVDAAFLDVTQVIDGNPSFVEGGGFQDQSGTDGGQTVNFDQTMDLASNTIYSVELQSIALFNNLTAAPGIYSTSAEVDPVISIDETFEQTNPGYTIEFSPNIVGVPETNSTLGLLALSFTGFVLVTRLHLVKKAVL